MVAKYLDAHSIGRFLNEIAYRFRGGGRFYLYGFAGLVLAGHREWATEVTYCVELGSEDLPLFDRIAREVGGELGIRHFREHPGEVIPLPEGYAQRARPIEALHRSGDQLAGPALDRLGFYHFDPYSIAFRFIARGDEQDYELVLAMLEAGWVNEQEMERQLQALLPRFSRRTIQQDPAEFRRKYRGLCQMWRAMGHRTGIQF
ncbi:MAG: hypothetical protein D6715_01715 [Calditrichaeota bacterium]|nr:MAG: hypothetical protein D6715_01715 [Calditrichota bacterium]